MSDEQMIPKSRFDDRIRQAREERLAFEAEISKLKEQNAKLTKQAGKAQGLAQQVEKLTADLASAGQLHTRQIAATRAGITDPEDMADALAIFERRAPEGVTFGDWLGSDTLPRAVRSMLPTQPQQTQPEQTQPEQTQQTQPEQTQPQGQFTGSNLPRPNGHVVARRPAAGLPSVGEIYRGATDADLHASNREALGLPRTNPYIGRLPRMRRG